MVNVRTTNDIILSLIDFYRVAQPLLDTKPGSVARDTLVDGLASQVGRLYEEINSVSALQSLRLSLGSDLDKLASNFGAVRLQGAKATGPALLTFQSLDADIPINKGDLITAKNGSSFIVLNSLNISPVDSSSYRATATRYRSDLDFVGNIDEFAVEILVEASASGIGGNISKYSLVSTSIPNITGVTNAFPFGGGRAPEDDAAFRNRVLAVFSGSNTGTALGYTNAALSDPSVLDAIVIEPGDNLMTRDGTQVSVAEDGTRTIVSEGTGGKVDIQVFGTRLQEVIDNYIFREKSNTGDVTNSANDFVLGQIGGDENKTVSRKRLDNIANGVLPNQPANNISQVTGSLSGSNFVEKSVDSLGRVTGNYELVKDTGAYAGSPWGFDKISWISDRISDLQEDKAKLSFNGQDPLSFTDLIEIGAAQQDIQVTNENSSVSPSDRSSIQLAHSPVKNVTRVFNSTTGERYVVSQQNPDGSDTLNQTGRIVISGQTLPAISDTLQVDYTWVYDFDPTFDFDNRATNRNPRNVRDSIDWGYSNAVRRERVVLIDNGSFLTATVTHPISSVISVNKFSTNAGSLTLSSGRLAFVASEEVSSVISITRDSDGAELWNTGRSDGSFSNFVIFLPTDSDGEFGESVTVIFNAVDVFNADTSGNFNSNVISVVPTADAAVGTIVECNYIANISNLLPATLLSNLPVIRNGNAFDTNISTGIGTQPTTHIFFGDEVSSNLRQAPSNLGLTIAGSVSSGVITVTGTTIDRVAEVVITVTNAGLTHNLSSAIKSYLGLTSADSVPSNVRLLRIAEVERVTTSSSLEVLEVLNTYDIIGYRIFDNSFVKDESVADSTLSLTQFTLPNTPDNASDIPSVGDRLRVTFYISTSNDNENVAFSKSGLLYTDKKFALVDTVTISSGFTSGSSAAATLTISNLNQPATRSRYKAFYDYTAPKVNERITIRYNYDRLVTDVTFAIENTRPITADVLTKAATAIQVDVEMNIVVTSAFTNSTEIVRQNVQDAITATLNAKELGTIVDSSDLVNTAYSVEGVDRVRILFFNRTGEVGSKLSIEAQKNEYIVANNVTVDIETR